MSVQKQHTHHSDLGPSSKDWQPGAVGRDEDYSPEKDLWAQTHDGGAKERGTAKPSREKQEADLDEELDESFPASDPPASTNPATGWDIDKKKN